MQNKVTFQPGTYYVGDPGLVLSNDDLRVLFQQIMYGKLKSGLREVINSHRCEDGHMKYDMCWFVATPNKSGTIYEQNGTGWGIEWGCFGVISWKWIENQLSFVPNKIEFIEPFDCFFDNNSITIGHLNFTYECPK